MSFWMKLGLQINDLSCFRESCKRNNVNFTENTEKNARWQGYEIAAFLRNKDESRITAYLVKDGGGFRLMLDNDANYSSLTRRLGENGGRLTRDYSVDVIKKQVNASGGMVNMVTEQPDGSMLLRVSTM